MGRGGGGEGSREGHTLFKRQVIRILDSLVPLLPCQARPFDGKVLGEGAAEAGVGGGGGGEGDERHDGSCRPLLSQQEATPPSDGSSLIGWF